MRPSGNVLAISVRQKKNREGAGGGGPRKRTNGGVVSGRWRDWGEIQKVGEGRGQGGQGGQGGSGKHGLLSLDSPKVVIKSSLSILDGFRTLCSYNIISAA